MIGNNPARVACRFAVLASFAVSVLPSDAVAAFDVAIKIDPTKPVVAANSNLAGTNVGWPGYGGALYANNVVDPRIFALTKGLPRGPMRYPAGEWADSYIWRDGVGAGRSATKYCPSASNSALKEDEVIRFGTDEFRSYCKSLSCTPVFQVNMHQGSDETVASRAVDWLKYVSAPSASSTLPSVQYWELGNEPYLKGAPDSGETTSFLYLSPQAFALRTRKVMVEMARNSSDKLKFLIPFALDSWLGPYCGKRGPEYANFSTCSEVSTVVGSQLGFAKIVLDELSSAGQLPNIHALALHYYMPLIGAIQSNVPSDVSLYWATMAGTETVARNLTAIRKFWNDNYAGTAMPRLSVTELNSLYTTSGLVQDNYVASQAGAMYVADLIRMLAYQPDVDMGMLWSISQNGQFGAIDVFNQAPNYPVYVRPHYEALVLGGRLLQSGASVVPLTVSAPTTQAHGARVGATQAFPDMPLATAALSRSGKTLRLLALNKDIGTDGRFVFEVDGRIVKASGVRVSARKDSQFASASGSAAFVAVRDGSIPVTLEAHGGKSHVKWLMPPTSFALITVELE